MSKFKPKWVMCILKTDSFKIECSIKHEIVLEGKKPFETSNTYRFTGRPLKYLIKNEADYNELMANPNFRDYVEPSVMPVSEPSETTKDRKLREEKEAEEAKALNVVPASQTDGINSINERPESQ